MKYFPFTNDLVFAEVMKKNPNIVIGILELFTENKISYLDYLDAQKVVNYGLKKKSSRINVFVKTRTTSVMTLKCRIAATNS